MLTIIKNALLGIEHDIEDIISTFTDAIKKLEDAAVAKVTAAEEYLVKASHYEDIAAELKADATKATDIATKIKALFS